MFCDYLWIFYINILSCGVFFEWEADGNFLTRVSGSEKYSIFRPVGIHSFFTKSIQGCCFVNNSFFLTKHAVFCPALPECKLQQVQPCWVARCCHFLEQTFFSKTKSERGFPISFCFWRLLSFYGSKALLGATLPMATNVAKITFPRTLRDILSPQAALTTIGAARCERMPCSLTPSTEFSRLNRRGM